MRQNSGGESGYRWRGGGGGGGAAGNRVGTVRERNRGWRNARRAVYALDVILDW